MFSAKIRVHLSLSVYNRRNAEFTLVGNFDISYLVSPVSCLTGHILPLFAKERQPFLFVALDGALGAVVELDGAAAAGAVVGRGAVVDQAVEEESAAWFERHS